MLSPNVISVSDNLVSIYSNFLKFDSYAFSCNNLVLGKLSPDPNWLAAARNRISMLSAQSAVWIQDKPEIWVGLFNPFIDYYTTFYGFNEILTNLQTKDQWIQMLQQLKTSLQKVQNSTYTAVKDFEMHYNSIMYVQPLIEQSIQEGWVELANEEKQMADISAQIQKFQDRIASLEGNLDGGSFRSGQSFVVSNASILYGLLTVEELSVPYLSTAALLFTIGKEFYDVFEADSKIHTILQDLYQAQIKASELAQAAAVAKVVLQTLYNLDLRFREINNGLDYLNNMWSSELEKIDNAISAIMSGSDPKSYFDLASMPIALKGWEQIAGYVKRILNDPPKVGKSLMIDVTNVEKCLKLKTGGLI